MAAVFIALKDLHFEQLWHILQLLQQQSFLFLNIDNIAANAQDATITNKTIS